ncbi:hypothetical protein Lal_00047931 [Lupinus albus]|nr:hypothetical protein Lal_00047931 [Lupinus albus]
MKKTRKSIDKTGTYQKHPSIYREDEAYTFFFFLSDLPKSEAYSIRIRDIGRVKSCLHEETLVHKGGLAHAEGRSFIQSTREKKIQ